MGPRRWLSASRQLDPAGNSRRPSPGQRPGVGPPRCVPLCSGLSVQTYSELADHLAADAGWVVLTFNFRGTGTSEGDFSVGGWLDDLRAAVGHLERSDGVSGVWVAGSSTGGALAICEAAEDERVR